MAVAPTQRILEFWFGLPGTSCYGERRRAWFEGGGAFDDIVRLHFEADLEGVASGGHAGMADRPEDALAHTILLDQFPRNIYRGTPQAFAFDAQALTLARDALDRGHDRRVAAFQRMFFYLPFEHSEALPDQERSVALFRALGDERALDAAIRHRDVIARFGRFPHRNAILGRRSTAEEIAFLREPGAVFGGQVPRAGTSSGRRP